MAPAHGMDRTVSGYTCPIDTPIMMKIVSSMHLKPGHGGLVIVDESRGLLLCLEYPRRCTHCQCDLGHRHR